MPSKYTINIAGKDVIYSPENREFPWIRIGSSFGRQRDPFPLDPYTPTSEDYYLMSSVVKLYELDNPAMKIVHTDESTFARVGDRIYVSLLQSDEEMRCWVMKHARPEEAFTREDVLVMRKLFQDEK